MTKHFKLKTAILSTTLLLLLGLANASQPIRVVIDDDISDIDIETSESISTSGNTPAIEAMITSGNSVGSIIVECSSNEFDPRGAAENESHITALYAIKVNNKGVGDNYVSNNSKLSTCESLGHESNELGLVSVFGNEKNHFINGAKGQILGSEKSSVYLYGKHNEVSNFGVISLDNGERYSAALYLRGKSANVINSGTIKATGENAVGVHMDSKTTSGTISNTGRIESDWRAIEINSYNVTLELRAGTSIKGDIFISPKRGCTVVVGADMNAKIEGGISMDYSKLVVRINSSTDFGKLWAESVSLDRSELEFKIGGGSFQKGDRILFLESDASIVGSFSNHKDGDTFESKGVGFELHIEDNKAWLEVLWVPIPEPAHAGIVIGTLMLALAALYRRN